MANVAIDALFNKERFASDYSNVLCLLLYSPFGLIFVILRVFMMIQGFLLSSLMRQNTLIRRYVLRVIFCGLGIIVKEERSESASSKTTRIIVSNRITLIDHLPIYLKLNCMAFMRSTLGDWLLLPLGVKNFGRFSSSTADVNRTRAVNAFLKSSSEQVLLFPEETNTNGSVGLLKFSTWWCSITDCVQPVAIAVSRPLNIKPCTEPASPFYDLFWTLFVPYTVYTVTYLPIMEKMEGETDDEFVKRVQKSIADSLDIIPTDYTSSDKNEYIRTCIRNGRRPRRRPVDFHGKIQRMAVLVHEVLPHVPLEAVKRDLERTFNVDNTIANILDGKVKFTPTGLSPQSSRQDVPGPSNSARKRNTITQSNTKGQIKTLAEMKQKLFEDARKKYKSKHMIA